MTRPITYYWPSTAGNTEAVANPGDYGTFVLNANNPDGSYTFPGMMRSVSITSQDDYSNIPIGITGIGCTVQEAQSSLLPTSKMDTLLDEEVIFGPNNSTVYSANVYKTILRIRAFGSVGGGTISAGYGDKGYTDFFDVDYNMEALSASLVGSINNRTNLQWSVIGTPNKQFTPNLKGGFDEYPEILPTDVLVNFTTQSSLTVLLLYPFVSLWVAIKDNLVSNTDEKANFTFIQSGIT